MNTKIINKFLTILILSFLLFSCSKNQEHIDNLLSGDEIVIDKMDIDENKLSKIKAIIKTVRGNIEIKFYPKHAPNSVTRVLELIQTGFYNGQSFHRVIPNALIQAGDPTGLGYGGSGIKFSADKNNIPLSKGMIAMTLDNQNTADSQFFIALNAISDDKKNRTIFGKVVSGLDVANQINEGDKIVSVSIVTP